MNRGWRLAVDGFCLLAGGWRLLFAGWYAAIRPLALPPPHPAILLSYSLLIFSLLLTSCSLSSSEPNLLPQSTQPVVKIGLIAPFEGLYRRSGYEALAAARLAVAAQTEIIEAAGVDLLVQALDDSALPERSARARDKLRVDPTVGAIIGPLAPWVVDEAWSEHLLLADGASPAAGGRGGTLPRLGALTVADTGLGSTTAAGMIRSEDGPQAGPFFKVPWAQPSLWGSAAVGGGAGTPFSQMGLIEAVGQKVAARGGERLIVSGLERVDLPENGAVRYVSGFEIGAVGANDSFLWLGSPADGAMVVNRLRAAAFMGDVWFGPWGGDPVLYERLHSVENVYWAIWQDSHYTEWAARYNLASPFAYLVYRSTEKAIWVLYNSEVTSSAENSSDWGVVFYEIGIDGVSRLYETKYSVN